jgi:hypothetical protein
MHDAIDEKLLKHLIYGRVVSDFLITQHADGQFMLSVRYVEVSDWVPVRSREKNPRTWARLDTLASQLWKLGVRKWYTELTQEVVTSHAHKLRPKKNLPE